VLTFIVLVCDIPSDRRDGAFPPDCTDLIIGLTCLCSSYTIKLLFVPGMLLVPFTSCKGCNIKTILIMMNNEELWKDWAGSLRRWGLQDLTASFLDVVGPLSLLGAQVVYISQPLLCGIFPARTIQALADLLEDNAQVHLFTAYLRKDEWS
jgi:hypothetical protein